MNINMVALVLIHLKFSEMFKVINVCHSLHLDIFIHYFLKYVLVFPSSTQITHMLNFLILSHRFLRHLFFFWKISLYSQVFFVDNFYWSFFRFRVSFRCHLPMVIMLISGNFNFRYCTFYLQNFYPVLLYHLFISVILLFLFHSTQVYFPLHHEA